MANNGKKLARLIARAYASSSPPRISLRSGWEIDHRRDPAPLQECDVKPDDIYLRTFIDGLCYLDPESWRFYSKHLMLYSVRAAEGINDLVVDEFIASIEKGKPATKRLKSLSQDQIGCLICLLRKLTNETSQYRLGDLIEVIEDGLTKN